MRNIKKSCSLCHSSETWSLLESVKGEDVIGLIGGTDKTGKTEDEGKLSLIACIR